MWPGFYALGAGWLLALTAPLVLLYFLKLKRPRVEVTSLVLWRRVVEDRRVNSPFQRFKRNLLLLLQLLLLILLALAAMQPFWRGGQDQAQRLPVLVDVSASMGALDGPGGASRLDEAKDRLRRLIDNLLPNQEMAIVAFSDRARQASEFTSNKRVLHDAVDRLAVEDLPADLESSLRLAQGLAQGEPFDRAVLLSDGNFPPVVEFALPYELDYQRLPPGGPNLGITAFSARRVGTDAWDVFVRVESRDVNGAAASGPAPTPAAIKTAASIKVFQVSAGGTTGRQVAGQTLLLGPGEAAPLVVRLQVQDAMSLETRLEVEGFDSLALDNTAYLELASPRPLRVFVPPALSLYRKAFAGMENVEVHPVDSAKPQGTYDLLVSASAADVDVPASTALFIKTIPADLAGLLSIDEGGAEIVDWVRSAELLRHVELADLMILHRSVVRPGVDAAALEKLGYETLIDGVSGPLLLQRREGPRLSFYMLFDAEFSDMPYRLSFPILLSNLAGIAQQRSGLLEAVGAQTGVLPPLQRQPGETLRVSLPGGGTRTQQADNQGLLAGIPAERAGRYEMIGAQGRTSVGVALLNERETRLTAVERIQFQEVGVTAAQTDVNFQRPLWRYLAMAALGVLLLEWWYFQRRPMPRSRV